MELHKGCKAAQYGRPLPESFFLKTPQEMAQGLLGKLLVRRQGKAILAGRIVETEAYLGAGDAAAHAAAGCTSRNAVLFGPPGRCYVFLIYGMHYCANVSCLPEGIAGGVLFRALQPLYGLREMAENRRVELPSHPSIQQLRALTSGPGRLAQALGIRRESDNGKPLYGAGKLCLTDDGFAAERIESTPRVGIRRSTALELRYILSGNLFVS